MSRETLKKKVTVIIVTFKSEHIIEKCLDNIGPNYNIILLENSNNVEFTNYLKKKYLNLDCINIGYDSGFGYALNRGIEKVKSEYIISINPDSFPEKDCFTKLVETADNHEDAVCVVPLTYLKNKTKEFNSYGYFDKKKKLIKTDDNKLEVDWVNGNVALIKKSIFNEIGLFDENFFIEYDERDFQKRIYKTRKKVIIDFDAKSEHLDGKSANEKYTFQMRCEKTWHHAWSRYYYYKKHYGLLYSLYINLPLSILSLIKMTVFYILNNKNKSKLHRLALMGFFNSLLNNKSFYRAEID